MQRRLDNSSNKAIILAAGEGKRLGEMTRNKPKALVELNGKPLIAHVIERLLSEGFNQLYINLFSFADMLAKNLREMESKYPIDLYLSYEKSLLDTGGGIKKIARDYALHDPILVHNVDIISNIPLRSFFNESGIEQAAAALAVQQRPTDKYLCFDENRVLCGRANPDKSLQKLYRKPSGELAVYAFCGVYTINAGLFAEASQESFSSIEYLLDIASRIPTYGIDYSSCSWADVGTLSALQKAGKNRILRKPMLKTTMGNDQKYLDYEF